MSSWKLLQEWVNTVGGAIAIFGAIVAGIGWTIGVMPFVRTDVYQNDMASIRSEVNGVKSMTQDNTKALVAVNRNTLLNLELSLRGRVELLNGTMEGVQRGGQIWLSFQRERDSAQQQLDEVRRELNK